MNDYASFLKAKTALAVPTGFEPIGRVLSRPLFDFQSDVVNWSVRRGRAALFEDCGLGKTAQQLAWCNEVMAKVDRALILAPLAVADQTVAEGKTIGVPLTRVTEQSECEAPGIYITNYAKLHRFDASKFGAVCLDESSILKSYEGSTRKLVTDSFRDTPYKLACTATPAPNDLIEIINHAEFLGVMGGKEIIALFFKQDGNTTHKWRLKGHAEQDFWRWLCTWAVNIRKPSDLGYADGNFKLPPLQLHEHVVDTHQPMDGYLFALPASTLQERRQARSSSLNERVAQAAELANSHDEPLVAWCNLNNESTALAKAINGAVELTGSDSDERKEEVLRGFADGTFKRIVTKPTIAGFGLNWQHCHNQVFVGLSDSYEQFYQAIRRCWRFGQTKTVNAHLVISSLEGAVLANLKRKEADAARMAEEMVKHMADISSKEIRGLVRDEAKYQPSTEIKLPKWIAA